MTGTDLCVNKCKQSRSYLKHLVYPNDSKQNKNLHVVFSVNFLISIMLLSIVLLSCVYLCFLMCIVLLSVYCYT